MSMAFLVCALLKPQLGLNFGSGRAARLAPLRAVLCCGQRFCLLQVVGSLVVATVTLSYSCLLGFGSILLGQLDEDSSSMLVNHQQRPWLSECYLLLWLSKCYGPNSVSVTVLPQ